MKRSIKNIIMVGLVVALAGASVFTWTCIGNDSRGDMNRMSQSSMGAPPDMQGGFGGEMPGGDRTGANTLFFMGDMVNCFSGIAAAE